MASLGHIAVAAAAGRLQSRDRPVLWMVGFSALSLAPDLDVLAFALGVPYEHAFGHRGATHALLVGLLGGLCALVPHAPLERVRAGALGIVVLVSHGLLDSMTTGGLGAALLWPFSEARYFAPWRPIPVAPIGAGMISARGLEVLLSEALLFLPLLAFAFWPRRRSSSRDRAPNGAPDRPVRSVDDLPSDD